MTHKACTKCGKLKPRDHEHFHAQKKAPDGLRAVCRECRAAEHAANKAAIAEKRRAHYVANRDRLIADAKAYYDANVEKQRESARRRHHRNREDRLEKIRAYRAENRDALLIKQRERTNREFADRYGTDLAFTIRHRMRSLLRVSLKKRDRSVRTEEVLGFSLAQLREHLSGLFTPGMTWEKFMAGEIHIDHVRPIASFNITSIDCPDFRECWALSNLQPLWAKDNLSKGAKF